MLSTALREALNHQVNEELASSYIYLGMAAYFQSLNLNGFANWMHVQAEEEHAHAMRFYNYLYDRGARVELLPISAPPTTWTNPQDAFESALAHERRISGLINELMNMAITDKDHATQAFLHWFVMEQIEEEAAADDIVQRLKFIGSAPTGVYLLNQELAQRQAGSAEAEGGE
jgi:ferritin